MALTAGAQRGRDPRHCVLSSSRRVAVGGAQQPLGSRDLLGRRRQAAALVGGDLAVAVAEREAQQEAPWALGQLLDEADPRALRGELVGARHGRRAALERAVAVRPVARPARLDAPRLARRRLLKPAQQRGPSRHVELRPGEQLQPRERAGVLDRLRRAHRRASRHPALQRSGLLAVEDGDPLAVCDGALHPEGSRGLHRFSFRGCREAVADCGQGSAHPPVKAGGVACGCGGPDGADRRPAAYALSSWCDCSRPAVRGARCASPDGVDAPGRPRPVGAQPAERR